MPTDNDVRRAHDLLDDLDARAELSQEQEKLLRSFLPERPKQKTLEEITTQVLDAWSCTSDNCWGGDGFDPDVSIEDWLSELHAQMKGLTLAKPAHPEFLETEADYEDAPEGTIVAKDDISTAWIKRFGAWKSTDGDRGVECPNLSVGTRRVLRWGWGE